MNDSARVRERDGLADTQKNAQQLGCRRVELIETPSADEFHRVPEPAVRQQTGIMQRHDAWVFEFCDRPRFVAHMLDGVLRGQLAGKHLDRDAAAQLDVFGLVDDTHPAARDLAHDAIAGVAEIRQLRDSAQVRDSVI